LIASEYQRRAKKWLVLGNIAPQLRRLFMSFNVAIVLPLAFMLCVGPLYAPFAALTLAQEWQWSRHCDSLPGEATLMGGSFAHESSSVSLHFKSPSIMAGDIHYNMSQQDNHTWTLNLDNFTTAQSLPSEHSISFNLNTTTISATCRSTGENSTAYIPCMVGTFHLNPLSFTLTDTRTNTTSMLAIHDQVWRAYNDAPSLWLQNSSKDTILQTSITKPNECQTLQVCFSQAPMLDIIAPLALILYFQDEYAGYCRTQRFQL
jgi:hypothetical protein